jgi:hypothetical protein
LVPTGVWDCNSLENLCSFFNAWATVNVAGVYVGDTPPVNPLKNQLWYESDTGCLFVHYLDPSGPPPQWVQIAGPPVKVVMDNLSIIGAGTTASPHEVGLVDGGQW